MYLVISQTCVAAHMNLVVRFKAEGFINNTDLNKSHRSAAELLCR